MPPTGRAPVFSAIEPIVAETRSDVTENDIVAGVRVVDDVDRGLIPVISDWGGWFDEQECPNGYPCTYRIVFLAFDSEDNFAEGARDVIITGRANMPGSSAIGASRVIADGLELVEIDRDELAWTGAETGYLAAGAFVLIVSGFGLILSARLRRIR